MYEQVSDFWRLNSDATTNKNSALVIIGVFLLMFRGNLTVLVLYGIESLSIKIKIVGFSFSGSSWAEILVHRKFLRRIILKQKFFYCSFQVRKKMIYDGEIRILSYDEQFNMIRKINEGDNGKKDDGTIYF